MWIKIRDLIISITKTSDDYDKKHMKIKFNSDDELTLNKAIKIPKNELKEIDIKNRACCYFDDTINGTDINFSNILLDKKLYGNISVYDISYKTSTGPKPLGIRFSKTDGLIIVLDDKTKHLILFDCGLFNKISDRIKYLIIEKVVLQIVLIIILGRSDLIHIIFYLLKKY